MTKRVVDTNFWMSPEVLDQYSVEDKYFYLYLVTNTQSSQVGIYSIPKKVMSFETGFTAEAIEVLIDRFSNTYEKIIYDVGTQEIALTDSLKWSVLKGGKPVSDLLTKELSKIKQGELIKKIYEMMRAFWLASNRPFDKTIMSLFEKEMTNRHIDFQPTHHQSLQNQNQNNNHNHNINHNQSHNHHQESSTPNREKSPSHKIEKFYQDYIGNVTPHVLDFIRRWIKEFDQSIVLESLHRAQHAVSPLAYAETILQGWKMKGVKSVKDLVGVDREYFN